MRDNGPVEATADGADPVAWLRQKIGQRMYLARHAIELGNAAIWTELSSGVLMTCEPDAPQEGWDGVHPLGDSSVTRLMEANDPQDTIARCEAELAILDEHGPTGWTAYGDRMCRRCVYQDDEPEQDELHRWVPYPCRTVRLMLGAYRYRKGFNPDWAGATGVPLTSP